MALSKRRLSILLKPASCSDDISAKRGKQKLHHHADTDADVEKNNDNHHLLPLFKLQVCFHRRIFGSEELLKLTLC